MKTAPTVVREAIDRWLGRRFDCDCGRTHAVTTRIVRFADRGGEVVAQVARQIAGGTSALIVSDSITREVAARGIVRRLRSDGVSVSEHVFEISDGRRLRADDSAVERLRAAVDAAGPGVLIGVGSGTINDVCKCVGHAVGLPYLCVPTAASMNGYASSVASLCRDGLKITEQVKAPEAIIVDGDVVAGAPVAMTAAGAADLLSKFVCHADRTVAHIVEGGSYCELPNGLSSAAGEAVVERLDAIAAGSRDGVQTLIEALILSGIAMAVAGDSTPASGAEHLPSHYWDMCAPDRGRSRLHGEQVAIGICISAKLYERLRQVDIESVDPERVAGRATLFAEIERGIREHFGPAAPAVIEQARRKHVDAEGVRRRCLLIKQRWSEILRRVEPLLMSHARVVELLERVGAPTTIASLKLSEDDAVSALRWARHIRARYTVFDLAAEIGLFDDDDRRSLLTESGVLASP